MRATIITCCWRRWPRHNFVFFIEAEVVSPSVYCTAQLILISIRPFSANEFALSGVLKGTIILISLLRAKPLALRACHFEKPIINRNY